MTDAQPNIQVHSIYIDAPAEKVWQALTDSEYSNKWGYGGDVTFEAKPGGSYINHTTDEMKRMGMGDVAMTATIVELDPPHRLVLDSQAVWHDEPPQRLTYEIAQLAGGLSRVTLTHDVTNAPKTASDVAGNDNVEQGGGGWPWTLASLKTLLETGRPMTTAGA
ncbi:transcriptional regulator [Pseudoclavibacter endophyticus]|uniref:Activator of Hsp90 ATPase homologue 1/2-like C-terminal domain-containing protein n=1 Tax=Pseudoclavibacter endophyticus TaxID=1778590 RepID=A0A6H9WT89_9MICO|nr:SRPBCC domain-containing protein [Pseudoclavibacter endophyticus]KAB1649614.1 hypothetical protein F8O04_05040 [Pseudoclavibacter endophyticus]GGA61223.1 transcriptional regulator [Pseudoclavibacter endophyticus]